MSSPDTRCKGVHIKMDRETHTNFKMKLVPLGVSMQEAFEEFARLVGNGSLSAHRMIDTMVRNRVREELASVGLKPGTRKRKPRYVSELDDERLYDMINEVEETADGDQVPPRIGGRDEAA